MSNERLFRKGQVLELDIRDIGFGGVGIARVPTDKGDFAVFVENTLPGQRVRAVVTKSDKRFAECRLDAILERSPEEVPTPYQPIPGAPYATWPIERQHAAKQRTAIELYRRIGKVENIEALLDEYIESPAIWHYRNKMEYSFSAIRYDLETDEEIDDFALGFKHRGTWWMVENLDRDSGMFDAMLESSLHTVRQWCIDSGLPAWHPPKRTGFYRYLVVRKSYTTDQLLINLVTTDEHIERFDADAFLAMLRGILGDRLAGLIHTINNDRGDRSDPLNGSGTLLFGEETIRETINGLQFSIGMRSFFQTNPRCAEKLYDKAMEYVQMPPRPEGITLDLFCGTGTITQLLARWSGGQVVGVDIVEQAIDDARANAARNGIEQVSFIAADAGRFLLDYPDYQGKIGMLVLDPPRAGITPKTLRKVIALGAPRIVYISCNPATQARDTETLSEAGYVLKKISFVDQFPHTSHLEAVALYEKP